MSAADRHLEGEALLELLLRGDEGELEREHLAHCATCRTELDELAGFVTLSRAALATQALVSPEEARRVSERVLASTTHEDLRLGGDLRLVGSFVVGRLRASRALRLAAASLLVHLFALPLLAWYGLRQQARDPVQLTFDPSESPEWPADPEEAALLPLVLPDVDQEPSLREAGVGARAIEGSLGVARLHLLRGAPRMPPTRADEGTIERLLRARAEHITAYASRSDAGAGGAQAERDLDGARRSALERALWAEALLDRYVLDGVRRPALGEALAALDPRDVEDSAGVLEAAALARAEAYGLLASLSLGRLERARAAGSVASELERLYAPSADGVRRVGPLDPAWRAALGSALDPELRSRPVCAAWLADPAD